MVTVSPPWRLNVRRALDAEDHAFLENPLHVIRTGQSLPEVLVPCCAFVAETCSSTQFFS